MTAPMTPEELPEAELKYLEDNIATVAWHLGRPGASIAVSYDNGVRLIVDAGAVLKEISRRLDPGNAQAARETCTDCGKREPCDDDCPNFIDRPSTPAPTDAGALADKLRNTLCKDDFKNLCSDNSEIIVAALSNSAPPRGDFDAVIDSVSNATAIIEQETRGDEQAALTEATYVKDICKRLRAGHQYSGIVDPLDVAAADLIETLYLTALPTLAAPRQSPRLEREGTISECVKAVETLKIRHAGKDAGNGYRFNAAMDEAMYAILALLSPDTTVVSSTSRCPCLTTPANLSTPCQICGALGPWFDSGDCQHSSKNRGAE